MTGRSTTGPESAASLASARGVAWVGAAKVLFIASGLSIQLVVPAVLGSPELFGLLSAATAALAIVTNTLTSTLVQTTSKLVSNADAEDPGARPAVERAALRIGAAIGLGIGVVFAVLAVPVATFVLADPAVAPLLMLGGVVIAAYGIYASSIGILNGRRTFMRQAQLDATFSTLRALGWIGGAALGFGALGVMVGFAGAAVLLAGAGLLRALDRSASAAPTAIRARFLSTFVPLATMQLALNGVLQLDVEVLKGLLGPLFSAAGHDAIQAAELASFHVGCYRGAQQLAFIPYQLSIAVTLVLFPVVAHARQAKDDAAASRATASALRFTLLALLFMEAPLVAGGAGAMRLVLPDAFAAGADALPVLALGQVAFALFALCATVLAGAGELGRATRAAVVGLVAMLGASSAGVLLVGIDGPVRVAAAAGSALGAFVALAFALYGVRRTLNVDFPWSTLARGVVAAGSAIAIGRLVPLGGALGTLASLSSAALSYLVVLVVTRELGAPELAVARAVFGGRGRGGPQPPRGSE